MVVQIISGFRGSGKTTFLNQCIEQVKGKTAVIQNDFGAQAVDRENAEGSLIYEEIGEGCICCGMALEFEEKMRRIAMEDCPDRSIWIWKTVRCRESMYAAKREGTS